MTSLVVEDDSDLRSMFAVALRAARLHGDGCEGGLNALRLVEQNTRDVKMLDLGLPRLPGQDVYRELTFDLATAGTPWSL